MSGRDQLAPVVRLAPAKLNLTLAIGARREDGFHDLHSIMAPLELADRLSLAPASGPDDSLHVVDATQVPPRTVDPDAYGSVRSALAEARRIVGRAVDPFPLAIRLEKHIPVAAGLAGGSSDAAAALDGALAAWGADVGPGERLAAAAATGSDVPFFLAGGIALVQGRGERVTRLAAIVGEPPGVLLVTPPAAASTREAFSAFDAGPPPATARAATRLSSEHLAAELGPAYHPMSAAELARRAGVLAVANDLAAAADALVPGLRTLRRALARLLGAPIGLSGSGPTLWALYPSVTGAEVAATTVRDALRSGDLEVPGSGEPFVRATSISSAPGRTA